MKKGNSFQHFSYSDSIDMEVESYKNEPAKKWQKEGEEMALRLFHHTADDVVAYKQFLSEQGIDPETITTIEQFKKIPLITKDNYLRKYPYEDIVPENAFAEASTISATSGSTGEPFFFPRTRAHDLQYERMIEIFLKNQFEVDTKKTLVIVGFGLGIWIGGVFTYKNFNKLSDKGYALTIIPVGVHKELYLKSFKKFAPLYDQIILTGYPPFIKEVLDAGNEYGIDWTKHHLRILTAAEGYSENFRKHIAEKAGIINIYNDIINIYGTVEQGTIAHETALSNLIRKLASEDDKIFKAIFKDATNIPTLAQYYPQVTYFEEIDSKVVLTAHGSSIPLVRYYFSDLGGVWGYDEMMEKLKELGIDLQAEMEKYDIHKKVLRLPFVYVYARADFALTFRGANIYPGEIMNALDREEFGRDLTGKFTMLKREADDMSQQLEIHVELQKGADISETLKETILDAVINELRAHNSEFNNEYSHDAAKTTPVVILHQHGDPEYFGGGGKQRWVKK